MFVFNVALGRVPVYADLGGASDSLILVPIEATTLLDEEMLNWHTLADALANVTESPTMGRITATDSGSGDGTAWLANDGWITPDYGSRVTRLFICYQPASGSTDDDIIPLVSLDVDWIPDSISSWFINLEDGFFEATGYTYV